MKKKIGIISDLHLGYRQYGLKDRENDFYHQYLRCIEECIKRECDIVIIAGDIFDNHNPSPKAIDVFEQGLNDLNKNGIIVLNIVGNHTQLQVKDHFPPDSLFKQKYDYCLLDSKHFFKDDGLFICGLPYYADHSLERLKKHITSFNEMASEYDTSILVLHQEFQEYCGFTGAHMSINDIEIDNFNFVICGHIHSRIFDKIRSKITYIQPGSIERMNTKEAADEVEQGKGVTIIDIDGDKLAVYFVRIKNFRKIFLEEKVTFEDLQKTEKDFEMLEDKIKSDELSEKYPPILQLKIFDKYGQLELWKDWEKRFSNITLMTHMIYQDMRENDTAIDLKGEDLTPLSGIKNAVKDWDSDEANLMINLFDKLSSKDKEVVASAKDIVDKYFEDHFDI